MTVFDSRGTKQPPDLLGRIRDLARRHRTLVSRISSAELLADSIALELRRIEECLEACASPAPARDYEKSSSEKEAAQAGEQLRRVAETGAGRLEIKPRADGPCEVRVDGGKQFLLPPLLADLLSGLSIEGAFAGDGLVGWKTLDEVAILLAKKTGRKFGRHTVTQNIYRLRKEMFGRGGVNPYLVQTNRRRGARFALRHRTAPVIESD